MKKILFPKTLFISLICICFFTILSCSYSTDYCTYTKEFYIYNYTSQNVKIKISPNKISLSNVISDLISPIAAGEESNIDPLQITNVPGIYRHKGGMFGYEESISYNFYFYDEDNNTIKTVSPYNSGTYVNYSVTGDVSFSVSLIETFLPLSIPVDEYNALVEKITDTEKRAYFEELYYHTPYETDYYKEELTECKMQNQLPSSAWTVQERSLYIRNAEKIADEYELFPVKEQFFFAYNR